MSDRLLRVSNLSTEIKRGGEIVRPVDGVSLEVSRGETVGVVGESGCGKTMMGLSIMRLLPRGGEIVDGAVELNGRDLVRLSNREMRSVRGAEAAMIFQDPMTSLNPTTTIGRQIGETMRLHRAASARQARARTEEVLALVGMPHPRERMESYPHELSGGLQQRAMIAMALACEPPLVIADEPTTALDVTIQAQILGLLDELKERLAMGLILITHDMGVIAGRADRVMVMYGGNVVETAPTQELFQHPCHPYTVGLLEAMPRADVASGKGLRAIPGAPPDLSKPARGCRFSSRCEFATEQCRRGVPALSGESDAHRYACFHPRPTERVSQHGVPERSRGRPRADEGGVPLLRLERVHVEYARAGRLFTRGRASVKAVSDLSLNVAEGETFGLVGESGCGKTTTGQLMVGLLGPTRGTVSFEERDLAEVSAADLRGIRRRIQFMFQDSYASLDPRKRIGSSLREPLDLQEIGSRRERQARVIESAERVGLRADVLDRFPHEFSGGQRQRICLARALMLRPRLVVTDEPVSALDVSVQAQVLELMMSLQKDLGLTYVVISHDLSVVRHLADRVGVMYLGKLVESGPASDVYERPAHPYTAGLIKAIPAPDPVRERQKAPVEIRGELPSPVSPPSGCRFRTRCPLAEPRCAHEEPALRRFGTGHVAACHFPLRAPAETVDGAGVTSAPVTQRDGEHPKGAV